MKNQILILLSFTLCGCICAPYRDEVCKPDCESTTRYEYSFEPEPMPKELKDAGARAACETDLELYNKNESGKYVHTMLKNHVDECRKKGLLSFENNK